MKMKISDKDRQILRELAAQVAELADRPEQSVRRELWRKHNDLHGERPMILCYVHDSWPEFWGLETEHPIAQGWEWTFRDILCLSGFPTDLIITKHFYIPYVTMNNDFGMSIQFEKPNHEKQGAYRWKPPLEKPEDFKKMVPDITVDMKTSQHNLEMVQDIFGDILEVELHGGFGFSLDVEVAWLRGMENLMLDMYDHPLFLHKLMAFLRDEIIKSWRYAENMGFLRLDEAHPWDFTDDLPSKGYDNQHVRLCDIRGNDASQSFVGTSPLKWEEFFFQYQKPVLEMFGQSSYGCCEPLHDRLEILKQLKNLRRISISPWADLKIAAESLKDKYILFWKPHPAVFAGNNFDENKIRKDLQEALAITRGCKLEIAMMSVTTTNNQPQRLEKWCHIVQEVVEEKYSAQI